MDATRVHTTLVAGDLAAAEEAAVAAHTAYPHPRLAEIVDQIAQRRTGLGRIALRDAVLERFDMEDPAEAAAALRAESPSPVLTGALRELFDDPPFLVPRTDGSVEAWWQAIAHVAVAVGDRRLREPLALLRRHARLWCLDADQEACVNMYEMCPLGGWLESVLGRALDGLPPVPPLTEARDAAWRAVEALLEHEARDNAALEAQRAAHALEDQVAAVREALDRRPVVSAVLPEGRSTHAERDAHVHTLRHGTPWEVRAAIEALAVLKAPEAAEPLMDVVFEADDASIRRGAAGALAQRPDPSLAPRLRQALRRASCESVGMVAQILGVLRDGEAVDGLLAVVASDASAHVRQNAVEALGWIGDPSAGPALCGQLDARLADPEHLAPLRRALVDTLGMLETREAVHVVRRAYEEGEVYDRRAAVTALGRIGAPEDLPRLHAHAEADDLYPRGRPALALALLAPETFTAEVVALLEASLDGWADSDATFSTIDSLRALATRRLDPTVARPFAAAVCAWCRRRRASTIARLHDPTPRASELHALHRLLGEVMEAWTERDRP